MSRKNMSEFKEYGEVASPTAKDADPVLSCLASTKYNVDPSNPLRYQIGLCDSWMAQRCSRGWDKYCEVYLGDRKNEDFTGKALHKWLREALESRFCRVDENAPGSYCFEKCDLVDPLAPGGAQVCKTMGSVVYRDSNKLYNIDTNYMWSNVLTAPSPIKFKGCKKVCDVFSLSDLTEDDRILNECLDRGVGLDIIQNLAENLVSNNVPIRNSRLKAFIDRFVINKNSDQPTPGFSSLGQAPIITNIPIATPAVNPYLPPDSIYNVSDVGNSAAEPAKNIAQPADEMYRLRSKRTAPSRRRKATILPPKRTEHFGNLTEQQKMMIYIGVAVLVVAMIMSAKKINKFFSKFMKSD